MYYHLLKVLIIIAMLSIYIPWKPENNNVSKILLVVRWSDKFFSCLIPYFLLPGILNSSTLNFEPDSDFFFKRFSSVIAFFSSLSSLPFFLSCKYSSKKTLPFLTSFLALPEDFGNSTISHLSYGKNCLETRCRWVSKLKLFRCLMLSGVFLAGTRASVSYLYLLRDNRVLLAIFGVGFVWFFFNSLFEHTLILGFSATLLMKTFGVFFFCFSSMTSFIIWY